LVVNNAPVLFFYSSPVRPISSLEKKNLGQGRSLELRCWVLLLLLETM